MEIENLLSRVDVEILSAYADNNMNATKAALSSKYDRKTVMYRLDRTQIKTGLNPRDFWDLHKLLSMIGVEGRCGENS